jgi:hypothetical protein
MNKKFEEKLCIWKKMTQESGLQYNEGNLRHCYWYCDGYQEDCQDYDPVKILDRYEKKN